MSHPEAKPPASKQTIFFRRTFSTVLLWVLVGGAMASMQSWAYFGLIFLLALFATIEYSAMLKNAGLGRGSILLWVTCLYFGALYIPFLSNKLLIPGWVDGFFIFTVVTGYFIAKFCNPIPGREALFSAVAYVFGFIYISYLFSYCARIVFLLPGESEVPGAFILLWLLAVTKFSDMGAYITGSLLGRNKMCPHISPGKTWEGFAGALAFSQLAGCGLYVLFPAQFALFHSWKHVIILGFLLSVFAVIGDLAESVVKRSLGAKDSGKMLPGIGGALDLIDSVCFTAPLLYFYISAFLLS